MNRALLLGIIYILLSVVSLAQQDDSHLIRRAYIDTLGIVPTAEEIDWYCVYNVKTAYTTCVEWILSQVNNKDEVKSYLLSESFMSYKKMPLSKKQINHIITYVAGDTHNADNENNIKKSKLKMINHAISNSIDDLEAIDYMCYRLMSRVTHLDEANYLNKKLKEFKRTNTEEQAWLLLFNEILLIEDVRCK